MYSDIAVAMGGRIAEELIFGYEKITSGASSDIDMATKMAKRHRGTYKPDHPAPYEIGRGKIETFIKCPACFYMDRVLGIKFPQTFGWIPGYPNYLA